MNNFVAHIRENCGEIEVQTVSEHCKGVAVLAEKYAKNMDVSAIAKLQGIIHDLGKLCRDFDDYIRG